MPISRESHFWGKIQAVAHPTVPKTPAFVDLGIVYISKLSGRGPCTAQRLREELDFA